MKFRLQQLKQAIKDGRLEVEFGEVKHQETITVRNMRTFDVFTRQVEEEVE